MKKFIQTILLFILALPFAEAQRFIPKFKRLNTNDGLSQGHVVAILKDAKGFMWFGTDEGLNKYDGYRFKVYKSDPDDTTSLSNSFVFDVKEDRSGRLWVATAGGLDLFDRKNDNFIHYGSPGKGSARTIFQDSRANIWIGTADGLFKLDEKTKKFKKYVHRDTDSTSISNDFIYRVVEDKQGRLWIATKDGLNLFNPKTEVFSCFRAGSYNT
ncbi:MAG: hypothetical protein H7Y27_01330, partial [Gemmatimonadaceae bacterium]|nr:hypothetical protein [Chitinophagaceae bacterium]